MILGSDAKPIDASPILIGDEDGGLARRQMFREVKERMANAAVNFRRGGRVGQRLKMVCAECVENKARNVRSFLSWDALRTHLIDYHGFDHREVPE